jgi:hypothetical protein
MEFKAPRLMKNIEVKGIVSTGRILFREKDNPLQMYFLSGFTWDSSPP